METGQQQYELSNLSEYIAKQARHNPDGYAVLHPEKIKFREFQSEIEKYTQGLSELELSKSHKVLFLVKPGPLMFILTFACLRLGAIPVLIDPGMGPSAMARALKKIDVDFFIGEPKAHGLRLFYPSAFRYVRHYINVGKLVFPSTHSIGSLRKPAPVASEAVGMKPDDEVAIFFTSGSTGPAKAVLYRNHMLHAQISILQKEFEYTAGEIDCCTFPLISLLVMCLGLSIVFADMPMTKPSGLKPELVINNINSFGCTHMFCSPMVLKKLGAYGIENENTLPSLKRVMTAGAIVSHNNLSRFKRLLDDKAEIHTPYGATEALPVTSISDKELLRLYVDTHHKQQGICIGYPVKGLAIKIIEIRDEEIGQLSDVPELDDGKVGEIIVKGNVVTQEYLGLENPRQSKIHDNTSAKYWHRMGDLGRRDKKERIWFYGRKSQRVMTEEGVLYTIPTEGVFNAHPLVSRSALVGLTEKDSTYESAVICIECVSALSTNKRKELVTELRVQADDHKIPVKDFVFKKQFPVDPRHNAKIYREKLKQWVQK